MTTSTTVTPEEQALADAVTDLPSGTGRRRSLAGYLTVPLVIAAALVILFVYIHHRTLDSIEAKHLDTSTLLQDTWRHLQLTGVSTVFVLLIAIPVGILLTRSFARPITPPTIAVFNVGQAVPSIGLVVLLAVAWDIGFKPAIVALVAYTILPVLRNTMVGLRQVDESVIESARGMGMTKLAVLTRIELPLAVPIIMAGLRTALTINVGSATLGTFIGAGGLGDDLVTGIGGNRPLVTIASAMIVSSLALLIDYVAGIAEDLLRPRGL